MMIVTPGPGVLTTAGIGSGFGWRAGLRFLIGLNLGTNLTMLMVATGLTAAVFSIPGLRTALLIASVAYFIYLATKIAFAGAKIGFIAAQRAPTIRDGILLQMINPKAYAVGSLLITGFAFYPDSFVIEVAWKFVLMNLVWIPVHILWLGAGVTVRRMELPTGTQRFINYVMAASLIVVVVVAAITASDASLPAG
ncbi:MAG: LysE family transporter [Pseudomonadota bacterium]